MIKDTIKVNSHVNFRSYSYIFVTSSAVNMNILYVNILKISLKNYNYIIFP
jgi:hypothetical protein